MSVDARQLENLAIGWKERFSAFLCAAESAIRGDAHAMRWLGDFFYGRSRFGTVVEVRSILQSFLVTKTLDGRFASCAQLGQYGIYVEDSREFGVRISDEEAGALAFDRTNVRQQLRNALHWYQLASDNGEREVEGVLDRLREAECRQQVRTLKSMKCKLVIAALVVSTVFIVVVKNICH